MVERPPPHRERHPPVPRRLLARHPDEPGFAAAQENPLPRLHQGWWRQDSKSGPKTEIDTGTSWRRSRRRGGPLLPPEGYPLEARRGLHYGRECPAKAIEADLANDLGNLLNRTVVLAVRALGGKVPARPAIDSHDDFTTAGDAILAISAAEKHWDTFRPSKALEETWKVIHMANVYFDRHSPWRLADAGELDELAQVLGMVLEMIRRVDPSISPAMPRTSIEILRQIGRPIDIEQWSSGSEVAPRLHGGATLFGWPGGKRCRTPARSSLRIAEVGHAVGERRVESVSGAPAPACSACALNRTEPNRARRQVVDMTDEEIESVSASIRRVWPKWPPPPKVHVRALKSFRTMCGRFAKDVKVAKPRE